MISEQKLADWREEKSIEAYARWRSWADEYALREIEQRLRGEVAGSRQKSWRANRPLLLAVVGVGLGALLVGALFALAVAQ